jgi:N-acylneuraminate cytidylyltransferase
MKNFCFIPIKENSKRVHKKNFQKIGGKKLYEITIEKAISSKCFDKIFVDTDSEEISKYCFEKGINYVERIPALSLDSANGNDLLSSWIERFPGADVYTQLHITCPFIKVESIKKCVDAVNNFDYDSSLTAIEEKSWYWFDKKPINYEPSVLPRSQDAQPVIRETTALYVIKKESFLKDRCRISNNAFFHFCEKEEGIDIDNPIDLEFARVVHTNLHLHRG